MNAKELVRGAVDLVSLPDVAIQVNEMIDDPRYNGNHLGSVISTDPGLSVRLLKIVNSAFYGFPAKIDTVGRATTIVGSQDLRSMVLATSAVGAFSKIPQELVDITDFWVRSIQCAIISRILAKSCGVLQPERLFVAGLLSDIGSLLMYSKLPDACREILTVAAENRSIVPDMEQELLGFTHADVGAELCGLWNLPDALRETVACHLNPGNASEYRLDACLVYVASRLCEVSVDGCELDRVLIDIPDSIMSLLKLDRDKIVDVLKKVGPDFASIFDLIVPKVKVL